MAINAKQMVVAAVVIFGVQMLHAQEQSADWPDWAYGYFAPLTPEDLADEKRVPPCPEKAKARSCGPTGPAAPDDGTLLTLPGTSLSFTRTDSNYSWGPADWYPGDHPAMPDIVANGDMERGIRPCSLCHFPNGQGKIENGHVSGLPANYIIAQLQAFKNGERLSADPRKANTNEMARIAYWLTDEEIQQAADYFSSIPFRSMVRVVESDEAPQVRVSLNRLLLPSEDGSTMPLGKRIIEVPEYPKQTEFMRNPRGTFVSYAPIGSVAKGEELVTTGGGKTAACGVCHESDSPAFADVPSINGRTASYTMRQLWDMKQGTRVSPLMKPIVENLTAEDMLNIVAYLATQTP